MTPASIRRRVILPSWSPPTAVSSYATDVSRGWHQGDHHYRRDKRRHAPCWLARRSNPARWTVCLRYIGGPSPARRSYPWLNEAGRVCEITTILERMAKIGLVQPG